MVQLHAEDDLGGTEQALIMLLGAGSTEGRRALEFVQACQDHYLAALGLLKECYTKCLQEEGASKGEELFKLILTLVVETISLHTTPVTGALPKALATQHLLACILGDEHEDTYFVDYRHDAMAIKSPGSHQNQAVKFNVVLSRISCNLPYDSDANDGPGDGGADGGASRRAASWTAQERDDWKRAAEAAAKLDAKTVTAHEKTIAYLNGISKSADGHWIGPRCGLPFLPSTGPAARGA